MCWWTVNKDSLPPWQTNVRRDTLRGVGRLGKYATHSIRDLRSRIRGFDLDERSAHDKLLRSFRKSELE